MSQAHVLSMLPPRRLIFILNLFAYNEYVVARRPTPSHKFPHRLHKFEG